MDRWNGKVALVTGASVGIGAGICRELVQHGMIVVGCARNSEQIDAIAKEDGVKTSPGRLHALRCDLTVESDILAVFQVIRQKFGRLDVTINNAGFSTDSPLLSGETADWKKMLEVNVLALSIINRETVKLMREKGIDDGQIININSTGGHGINNCPPPFFGAHFYCGSKFMVRALTQGIRAELKATNTHIRVASISPGVVETEFLNRMFEGKEEILSGIRSSSMGFLKPSDIADAVLYILRSPPHVDVNEVIVRPIDQQMQNCILKKGEKKY